MQTRFSPDQRADPDIAVAEPILRACVHCGFCQATCPTYALLGDELDGPRGRIYLMKEMLESGRPPTAKVVGHIDRCLSCLSCMTTCPSGVHYMHLVDLARRRIRETFRRPAGEAALRRALVAVLPHPARFRLALLAARLARPFAGLLPAPLARLVALAPPGPLAHATGYRVFPAEGPRRARVALLAGCVQQIIGPRINDATVRLLTRLGCEVVIARESGCCGAIAHHMGEAGPAEAAARANIAAWQAEIDTAGLDAVVVNASGCGVMVKDYGHLFRDDPALAQPAQRIAALACDVSELIARLGLTGPRTAPPLAVAYHSACALQHGQRLRTEPQALLREAGFSVAEPAESHLCCGSAGTYNILQPALADRLRARKADHLERLDARVIATGNIGCMVQIAGATARPVVHTVELLDWATGGPRPAALEGTIDDGG